MLLTFENKLQLLSSVHITLIPGGWIRPMKCVLIISSLPDILFVHADKAFIKHVNKLSRNAGFISDYHNEDEMDMTALSQIFSPMILSLTYMNDVGNPFSSILCEDGTLFVFNQVCIYFKQGILLYFLYLVGISWVKVLIKCNLCLSSFFFFSHEQLKGGQFLDAHVYTRLCKVVILLWNSSYFDECSD